MHYKVSSIRRIPWEIHCHQINFKFWNHNRFGTWVIDFVGQGLPAIFTLFPDTTNWHHGSIWLLNSHLHTTHRSYLMLSQCLYFFGLCHRLNKVIYTLYILTHYHRTRQNRVLLSPFEIPIIANLIIWKNASFENHLIKWFLTVLAVCVYTLVHLLC